MRYLRRLSEFGVATPTGFAIVGIVSLIDALRISIKWIVSKPFDDWSLFLLTSLASAAFIGCTILLAIAEAIRRHPRHGRSQYIAVFTAIAASAGIAVVLMMAWDTVAAGDDLASWNRNDLIFYFIPEWARYATLGMLIAGAWLYVRANAEQSAALKQVALDSARMDQQIAEARLQMLEAQIEPHFLFNTLAHVKRLYDVDRGSGARMMQNLKAYLAIALPQMRETESTLEREFAHVTAYLNINQIRMGRRLAFDVDLPESLRDARMPPLMILTLVENAIKHGLGPAQRGGRISLRASTRGSRLVVEVADTGQGFSKSKGGGTGLANIRARLRAQFGDAADLSLQINAPHGVIATLTLPLSQRTVAAGTA